MQGGGLNYIAQQPVESLLGETEIHLCSDKTREMTELYTDK